MKEFARGLVVGKFCPLHLGHESVIQQALNLCGEVYVISYTKPEFPGCGPEQRRQWLTLRFPSVHSLVLEDGDGIQIPHNEEDDDTTHRRFVGQLCQHKLEITVDAVFTSESYGEGFAGELTDIFRKNFPSAPSVTNVLVDQDRTRWPISGTTLRSDIHQHRHFLAPEVYASFVERVALLGGESSGKTTLAAALAKKTQTEWVAEYGRELWEERGGSLRLPDMSDIAGEQIRRENAACLRANRWVICDSTPLTTRFYSEELFGRADQEVIELSGRPYHHTVLCAPDIPFSQDGTRQNAAFRQRQHDWYVEQLNRREISYLEATGPLKSRVKSVLNYLQQ